LINNLEPGDGLILDNSKFAVLIADNSEKFVSGNGESFLTVDANGVKIDHIQEAIDVEKERALEAERVEREARIAQDNVLLGLINTEKNRAIGEETRIETKLDNEIADRNTHNNEHDAAIANLQSAISNMQATIVTQSATISSLQTALSSLEGRVRALEDRI
jgi:chromosome segregation ATPase